MSAFEIGTVPLFDGQPVNLLIGAVTLIEYKDITTLVKVSLAAVRKRATTHLECHAPSSGRRFA